MSFDWKTYLDVSEALIKNRTTGFEEAYLRSAISRAYYAVFGIARSYLKSEGTTISAIDTHKFLRNEFKNSPDNIKKKIGNNLERLWRDRKEADYNDTVIINNKRAQLSYQMAVLILQYLKRIGAV
jgi:uncharacterized protein (UPF0332 family)